LELGIDIGHLDAAVLCGYPGTIASAWQQIGRAGRRGGAAAAVYVASSSPLDQYLVNHPEYFLGRDPEQGLIDPDNLLILSAHLQAATFELPLSTGEPFGEAPVAELLRILEEDGAVHQAGDTWHWSADAFPAQGAACSAPRRGASHRPADDLQEDPVPHPREHRIRTDQPARATAAYDGVLVGNSC